MKQPFINTLPGLILTLILSIISTGLFAQQSGLTYIEGDIRISPKNNVFDKTAPRDLNFVVHHPDTRIDSLTYGGQKVEIDLFMFTNLGADGKSLNLPYTSKIDLKQDFLDNLAPGSHTFQFYFANGVTRKFNLEVVDESTRGEYELEIISFNVEHGDAVLIRLPNTNILVDAGPGNMAESRVVPCMKERGIEKLDFIFTTHWHWDHVDGLKHFIKDFQGINDRTGWLNKPNAGGFDVENLWHNLTDGVTTGLNEPSGEYQSRQTHTSMLEVGNEFTIDGAKITVLNAARFDEEKYPHYRKENFGGYDNKNNRSLSFRLEYNGFVFTSGGDIYQQAQNAIMNTFDGEFIKSHVYHGNHHFHGGLSPEYLKAVDPYLFLTPAEEAAYNRQAYVEGVMGNVVPYLEGNSNRFIENLFSFEVGHTIIRANDPSDWKYETHYINQAQTKTPLSLGLLTPSDGAEFNEGESIGMTIDVNDPSGKLEQIQLFASRQLLRTFTKAPYEYTWEGVPEGRYMISARGFDSEGNSVASTPGRLITVGTPALPDTLIHHWKFDEETGSVAPNSANIYDGYVNGATWTTGRHGNALSFNGVTDYVEVPHNEFLNFDTDFTIAAWIFLNDPSGSQQVLQKGTNYSLFEARPGKTYPSNVFNDGSNWHLLEYTKDKNYFTGEWRHIAFTYDGSEAVNYIDGELDGSFNIPGTMATNTDPLGIGTNSPWNQSFFNGKIDELVIYEYALPLSDIRKIYNNELEGVDLVTSIGEDLDIPKEVTLQQNYPNPFNPATQIQYQLPVTATVNLTVYDMIGRRVATIVSNQRQAAGSYTVKFDASGLSSGIYMYRLQVDNQSFERNMTVIK